MTLFRKKIIACYSNFLTAEIMLFQAALHLHMHFEIGEFDRYLNEGYEFNKANIEDSDDPVVIEINKYLDESDNFISALEENNLVSAEDVEIAGDDEPKDAEGKEVKANNYTGLVIFFLTVKTCALIEESLKTLCEIKNEVIPPSFKQLHQYNDGNIQSIAAFYIRLCDIINYLEKETNAIGDKRNW